MFPYSPAAPAYVSQRALDFATVCRERGRTCASPHFVLLVLFSNPCISPTIFVCFTLYYAMKLAAQQPTIRACRGGAFTVTRVPASRNRRLASIRTAAKDEVKTTEQQVLAEAEKTTEKYGLEAGLYQVLTSKEEEAPISKTEQAKRLLAQYGSAYLITSISFAIVSFACCYAAVNAGVDVAGLLAKVGLQVTDTSEKVGTFAIAYAAHKALSPVRFPPTVALTPLVAKWTGMKKQQPDADSSSSK